MDVCVHECAKLNECCLHNFWHKYTNQFFTFFIWHNYLCLLSFRKQTWFSRRCAEFRRQSNASEGLTTRRNQPSTWCHSLPCNGFLDVSQIYCCVHDLHICIYYYNLLLTILYKKKHLKVLYITFYLLLCIVDWINGRVTCTCIKMNANVKVLSSEMQAIDSVYIILHIHLKYNMHHCAIVLYIYISINIISKYCIIGSFILPKMSIAFDAIVKSSVQ